MTESRQNQKEVKKQPPRRKKPAGSIEAAGKRPVPENPKEMVPKKKKPVRRHRPETENGSIEAKNPAPKPQMKENEGKSAKKKPAGRKRPQQEHLKNAAEENRRQQIRKKVRPDTSKEQQIPAEGVENKPEKRQKKKQKKKPQTPRPARTWTRSAKILTISKYGIVILILGYIVTLFLLTGGSTRKFSEVEKSVEQSVEAENLTKATGQQLKRYYGLNSADFDGFMLYVSNSSTSAEEVLLVEVKDSHQIQDVQDAIQKRIDNRKASFSGYAQDQVDLLNSSVISVRGRYIFFTVSSDATAYKKAFTDSL